MRTVVITGIFILAACFIGFMGIRIAVACSSSSESRNSDPGYACVHITDSRITYTVPAGVTVTIITGSHEAQENTSSETDGAQDDSTAMHAATAMFDQTFAFVDTNDALPNVAEFHNDTQQLEALEPDYVSEGSIRLLCQSGRVCEVMGHQWKATTVSFSDDTWYSWSQCRLCGRFEPGSWTETSTSYRKEPQCQDYE